MTEESTLVADSGGSQLSRLSRHRRVAIAHCSSLSHSLPSAYTQRLTARGAKISLNWSRLGLCHPNRIDRAGQAQVSDSLVTSACQMPFRGASLAANENSSKVLEEL